MKTAKLIIAAYIILCTVVASCAKDNTPKPTDIPEQDLIITVDVNGEASTVQIRN